MQLFHFLLRPRQLATAQHSAHQQHSMSDAPDQAVPAGQSSTTPGAVLNLAGLPGAWLQHLPAALSPGAKYKKRFQGYFHSEEYYQDVNQTRTTGGATSPRSAYDNDTSAFWAGGPGTHLIHGQWINMSYYALPDTYTILQQAKYFAQLGAAISDASLTCFRVKYEIPFWRPVTAIRQGDNTPAYTPDPTLLPHIDTPPHPSYPSGHMCLAQAGADILSNALGTSTVSISVGSEAFPGGTPRMFDSTTAVVVEFAASRILGGVHYKRDTAGQLLGSDATKLVLQRMMMK